MNNIFYYDRYLVSELEWWRLFTCNFTHYNFSHFLTNTLIYIILGYIVETKSKISFFKIIMAVVLLNGICIFFFEKNMIHYFGISGVNYALAAYILLILSKKHKIFIGLFVLLFFKAYYGFSIQEIDIHQNGGFYISNISHLLGLLCGFLIFIFEFKRNKIKK